MFNIEEIREKLKLLYFDAMIIGNIYTKDEAIELFSENEFSDEDSVFIQMSSNNVESKDDAAFDFLDDETAIEYTEDIENELLLCDDDKYFYINASYEYNNKNISKILYNSILTEFTINEYPFLIKILKDDCKNLKEKYICKINYEFIYLDEFLNSEIAVSKFRTNKELAKEIILAYIFNYEEVESEKLINKATKNINTPSISTLNDTIRNLFVYLFNNCIKHGVMPNDFIAIIQEYLNNNLSFQELRGLFTNIDCDNINFALLANKDYIKRIMICDYCRLKELQANYDILDEDDLDQLSFIKQHNINTIFDNFQNNNFDFAYNIISDFLCFNNEYDFDVKLHYNNHKKLLKKINPYYMLDFVDFRKKPKN